MAIAGSGFRPSEAVTLVLITPDRKIIIGGGTGAQVTANDSGAFVVDFDAIGGSPPLGVHTLKAEGSGGSVASKPIVIAASTAPTPEPQLIRTGTSLVANVLETGGTTTVWGAGFLANELVTLTVLAAREGQDLVVMSVASNGSGAFMVDAIIDLGAGVYTLKAFGDLGSEATAPLLVTEPK